MKPTEHLSTCPRRRFPTSDLTCNCGADDDSKVVQFAPRAAAAKVETVDIPVTLKMGNDSNGHTTFAFDLPGMSFAGNMRQRVIDALERDLPKDEGHLELTVVMSRAEEALAAIKASDRGWHVINIQGVTLLGLHTERGMSVFLHAVAAVQQYNGRVHLFYGVHPEPVTDTGDSHG